MCEVGRAPSFIGTYGEEIEQRAVCLRGPLSKVNDVRANFCCPVARRC